MKTFAGLFAVISIIAAAVLATSAGAAIPSDREALLEARVDTAYCASGGVQCSAVPGHTFAAASSTNHNPVRVLVQVSYDGQGVTGLTPANFTFTDGFTPAGGISPELCAMAICGPFSFQENAAGLYAFFLDPGVAGNWKAGTYAGTLAVAYTSGDKTYQSTGIVTFVIPE